MGENGKRPNHHKNDSENDSVDSDKTMLEDANNDDVVFIVVNGSDASLSKKKPRNVSIDEYEQKLCSPFLKFNENRARDICTGDVVVLPMSVSAPPGQTQYPSVPEMNVAINAAIAAAPMLPVNFQASHAQLTADVTQLTAGQGQLSADVAQLSADVAQLTAGQGQLSTDVAQLSANVAQLTQSMNQLQQIAVKGFNGSASRDDDHLYPVPNLQGAVPQWFPQTYGTFHSMTQARVNSLFVFYNLPPGNLNANQKRLALKRHCGLRV